MAAALSVVIAPVEEKAKEKEKEKEYNIELPNHITYALVKESIGSGAGSTVYRVVDKDKKEYALRVKMVWNPKYNNDDDIKLKFLKKLQKYPWVAQLKGSWTTPCKSIFSKEFIDAHAADRMENYFGYTDIEKGVEPTCYFQLQTLYEGSLHDFQLTTEYLEQMCFICVQLGKLGIVHGDIKPDNFLLFSDPDPDTHTDRLVISDFEYAEELKLNTSKTIQSGWDIEAWKRRTINSPNTNDEKKLQSFATYFNLAQLFFSFQWKNHNEQFLMPDGTSKEFTRFFVKNDPFFKEWEGLYPFMQVDKGNVYVVDFS